MSTSERKPFSNPVIEWVDSRLPIFTFMNKEYGQFPTPINFNYLWNFGALSMVMLVIMIVTGIFLAMNYTPSTDHAFNSIEHIMRDVNGGWLLRYAHANGASMFFIVVYVHILRGVFYGSYKAPRELLWIFGMMLLLLMMMTAFMGYVLPWGQMSFWGATVITSMFSAIPFVGQDIVTWLWGGFSVDNPTLNRFYALHYLLPFAIVGMVLLHVAALHVSGSNNPLGIEPKSKKDTIPFHPYYTVKDLFGVTIFLIIYAGIVCFAPNYLGHPDNYIPANPLSTPAHIVPEWYFLPFYAILRAMVFDIPLWILGVVVAFVALALRMPACTRGVAGHCPLGVLPIYARLLPEKPVGLPVLGGLLLLALLLILPAHATEAPHALYWPVLPSKLAGVLAMFGAIAVLFVIPWLDLSKVRSLGYRPIMRVFFFLFVVNAAMLGYCGSKPPEGIYPLLSLLGTLYYFGYFLVLMPVLGVKEKPRPLPLSITDAVLAKTPNAAH